MNENLVEKLEPIRSLSNFHVQQRRNERLAAGVPDIKDNLRKMESGAEDIAIAECSTVYRSQWRNVVAVGNDENRDFLGYSIKSDVIKSSKSDR